MPTDIRRFGVTATHSIDAAITDADVIMLLRIQLERMEGAYFPSLREYFEVFGMTEARMKLAKPDVMIMLQHAIAVHVLVVGELRRRVPPFIGHVGV